jgi:UDP-glucose 4-epimerase
LAILVTGGLGYVGSHSVKQLLKRGEQVVAYDNLIYGHLGAKQTADAVIGDIGDAEKLREVFKKYDIDAVMHFAALASVPESVADPQKYYINNIQKSLTLLQVMLEHDVKKFIFSSSAATFGEPQILPIPEDHPKNPTNPYGRSKLMLEHILAEYDTAYGMKSVSLRYFNASGADPEGEIGEDHKPEGHLIPLIIQQALSQREDVKVFGTDWDTPDGSCVRDYVHVTDLAQAHMLALDSLRNGGPTNVFNLGNGNGYSVKEVIDVVSEVSGKKVNWVAAPRRAGDPARLVASSDRIKKELGWTPQYADLKTIVETAWAWHSSHPDGYGDR